MWGVIPHDVKGSVAVHPFVDGRNLKRKDVVSWARIFYNCFFKWPFPASFLLIFVFSGKHFNFYNNWIYEKCPSSIPCWDSNPRPTEHESPPITTRPPGLDRYFNLHLNWNQLMQIQKLWTQSDSFGQRESTKTCFSLSFFLFSTINPNFDTLEA